MGGKDSIIVDDDANLDAAVEGVAQAAFGFQGQKCSACSRAIVDEKIYDVFLERLKDRVAKITVGDPTENKPMGPVVNEKAMKSILDYIEVGKKEGRLIHGGGRATEAGDGYFIQPTVIADVPPMARISQEEIFGPVLAVIKARNFEDALAIANDTEFGLTGAVYSTSRESWRRRARSSMWAICISTANAPARWWACIRLAASTCPARIQRRAARIICCCLRRQNPWRKKLAMPARYEDMNRKGEESR